MADGVEQDVGGGDVRVRARLKNVSRAAAAQTAASIGERFDIDAWRSEITDRVLIAVAAMGAIVVASSIIQAVNEPAWWSQTAPFIAVYLFLLALTLLRRRLNYRIRAWGLLLVGYAVAVMYLAILGLLGNGVVFLLALPALGLIILGIRSGVVMALLSVVLYLLFTTAAATGVMANWLIITENTLEVGQWLSQGLSFALILLAVVVMLAMFNHAQGQALSEARRNAAELAAAHDELAASSVELDRYARLLETAAGISHEVSSVLARDELLQRAVTLLAERLDLEGVIVYLVDGARAGDGNSTVGGRRAPALVRGPAVGRTPAIGAESVPRGVEDLLMSDWRAVAGGEELADSRAVSDDAHSAPAEHLAEVALPLRAGTQLLGVLYVESPPERPLAAREVQSLRLMADQLAIALDNARLFAEVEARLDELSALHKHYTREAWAGFVQDRPRPEYRWQPTARPGEHDSPSTAVWREVLDEARAPSHTLREHRPRDLEEGPVTRYDEESNQHVVAVPVRLREAIIGVLAFHRPREAGAWQPEELAAIEAVATRLAFAAENLRLLEQTQRRAARERLVDEISGKMQASLDPGTILKVAVREVGRALGASRSVVEIGGRDYSERGPGGNGGAVEEA